MSENFYFIENYIIKRLQKRQKSYIIKKILTLVAPRDVGFSVVVPVGNLVVAGARLVVDEIGLALVGGVIRGGTGAFVTVICCGFAPNLLTFD